jgi:hypothetical protein
LNRNGGQAGKSGSVTLTVAKIVDEDPRFPKPNIAGNTSDVLHVQDLTADARILAVKWPLFEPGQPIWVTCAGIDKNGNPVSKNVRSGEPNDAPEGLSVAVPIEWFKDLKNGPELTIRMKVKLDRETNSATSTSFPAREYKVRNYNNQGYENWEAEDVSKHSIFFVDTPETMHSGLTITSLNTTELRPGLRAVNDGNPGTGLKTMASGGYGALVKFDLPRPSIRISFRYFASHRLNRVSFYGAQNELIANRDIIVGAGTVSLQTDNPCAYFITNIHDGDGGITIDDITWDV